jgi:hypothetical protein
MKRFFRWLGPITVLPALGGCLPDNFFSNLLGSTTAEVTSALLSDVLNTFLPPV